MIHFSFLRLLLTLQILVLFLVNTQAVYAQDLREVRISGADSSETLIIFIHGVNDDGEETFKHRRSDFSWPEMLAQDSAYRSVDIASFHYPANVWHNDGLTIGDVADTLKVLLNQGKYAGYKNYIFVAHSMGGLVVRSFLLKNRDFGARVPLLLFLATPTAGSNLANIASIIVRDNAQIAGLQKLQRNNELKEQMSSWESWQGAKDIGLLCAYENVKTKRAWVVDRASATLLCNLPSVPVNENHSNIAKPRNENAIIYIAFKTAFENTLVQPIFQPNLTGSIILDDSFVSDDGLIIADTIVMSGDVVLTEPLTIFANSLQMNGNRLSGPNITIVATNIAEGTIDVSGTKLSESAGDLVVASASLAGVSLIARGGSGQNGKDGVNGLNGARGTAGRDGRCDGFGKYRGARPGEDGRDGGVGEDGGDGKDGGDGGQIHLVSLSDISTFSVDLEGGLGGSAGRGGQGGQGGQGGPGGRGCVGLGGSQSSAANGSNGADGRNGVDGRDGRKGKNGEIWFTQVNSLLEISNLIEEPDYLADYADEIGNGIRALSLR